jgi:hypothetical protein
LRTFIPIFSVSDLVTLATKTRGRLTAADQLIRSVRYFYPDMRAIVADDAKAGESLSEPALFIPLPYDAGLSTGRNAMLERVETPFVLLLDDDHIVTGETDISFLLFNLLSGNFDIMGIKSVDDETRWNIEFSGILYRSEDNNLVLSPGNHGFYRSCSIVDFLPNLYVARVATIQQVSWDSRLKLGEHEDFFYRAKYQSPLNHPLRIASCRTASISHVFTNHWTSDHTSLYAINRFRVYKFFDKMIAIHRFNCMNSFGSSHCPKKRLSQEEVEQQVCAAGYTGDDCQTCRKGYTGQHCDECLPQRFSGWCRHCKCQPGWKCDDGMNGSGNCTKGDENIKPEYEWEFEQYWENDEI